MCWKIYLAFFSGPLQNPFFYGTFANQSVDSHLFGLTKTMGPVHGLLIYSRVPIAVIKNYLKQSTD